MLHRRGFLGVLCGVVAAPMVVRAQSLMPVKVMIEAPQWAYATVTGYDQFGEIVVQQLRLRVLDSKHNKLDTSIYLNDWFLARERIVGVHSISWPDMEIMPANTITITAPHGSRIKTLDNAHERHPDLVTPGGIYIGPR